MAVAQRYSQTHYMREIAGSIPDSIMLSCFVRNSVSMKTAGLTVTQLIRLTVANSGKSKVISALFAATSLLIDLIYHYFWF